jgi:membrane fusion protein, copper/silver efflux system
MKENLRNKRDFVPRTSYLVLIFLMACVRESAHNHDTYTCPMHPTVISDRPATCPVCGMDLVRKARPGEAVEITEDLSKLIKSPNEVVVASIKTITGEYKSVPVTAQAQGVVTYDTRNIYTIPARVGGRIEKIYLKYAFQEVSKGQKIAEIYSPQLITVQRELLFLLEHDAENKSLIEGARRRLELLGMTSGQINELAKNKEAGNTISIYSPYSGYLIVGQQASSVSATTTEATSSANGSMGDGMGSTPSSVPAQQQMPAAERGSLVREGDYVTAGQTLFTVVNNNALRIELDVPGSYNGIVSKGSKVELDFGGESKQTGTIDFVQPFFTEGQDFLKIRVYIDKTQGLHIGHLVNATIHLHAIEALWIPKEAVLVLGVQRVVFLKDRGVFKPKEVVTGISSEGLIEIKSGLASSDEIAANAQFLVDSESFIKPVK